jgi:hypothetical protein
MLDQLYSIMGIESGPPILGTIKVELRLQFGAVRAYPVCANAHAFARIARRKTLSADVLNRARELGYRVETTQRQLSIGDVV